MLKSAFSTPALPLLAPLAGPVAAQPPYPYESHFPDYVADEDLRKVQAARVRLAEETRALEARLLMRRLEVKRTTEELKALGVI